MDSIRVEGNSEDGSEKSIRSSLVLGAGVAKHRQMPEAPEGHSSVSSSEHSQTWPSIRNESKHGGHVRESLVQDVRLG